MHKSSLTNDIIDQRLKDIKSCIVRVGDFKKSAEKLLFKCTDHNITWSAITHNMLKGYGCEICGKEKQQKVVNKRKFNDEIVDNKIKFKNIKRIGKYTDINTKLKWKCEKCNYEWNAIPYTILHNKSGCPKCAGQEKWTNERIDSFLLTTDRKIKRISDYSGNKKLMEWSCDECKVIWKASPGNVLCKSKLSGCPICFYKREKFVKNILEKLNQKFEIHKHFNIPQRIHVDFYIPEKNIIIEYNGQQHYEPVKFGGYGDKTYILRFENQKKRDINLRKYAKSNKIKLLEIPYYLSDKQINRIIEKTLCKIH